MSVTEIPRFQIELEKDLEIFANPFEIAKYLANASDLVNNKCYNVVQNIDSSLVMQFWSIGSDRLPSYFEVW